MRAGNLDRSIKIISATSTPDGYGQETETPQTFWEGRAQVVPVSANERLQGGATQSVETLKFRIRYKAGILPTMKIEFEGKMYRITGIAEIMRRRGVEIVGEIIL